MNVVNLPSREPLCIVCDCGGTTFRIISTGEFECSCCNEVLDDDISGVDYDRVAACDPDYLHATKDMGTHVFAFESVKRQADSEATAAIVVMNKDGRTHVWSSGADNDDQLAWFQERVDELMEQLK